MLRKYQFDELAAIIAKKCNGEGIRATEIAGVHGRQVSQLGPAPVKIYAPSLIVIAQGHEHLTLQGQAHHYRPGQFLALAVDMPLAPVAVDASRDKPLLSLHIPIDLTQLGDLYTHVKNDGSKTADAHGVHVGDMDASLIDSVLRLARLLQTPDDAPALAPMILREIYYRLLCGREAPALIELAIQGSAMQRIARVIEKMRTDISQDFSIDDLAGHAQMSPSSFHAHFKRVTGMSPLQYIKHLRLIAARDLLIAENINAAHAARAVGYESPSQFSREYARMFGAPPKRNTNPRKTVGRT